MKTQITVFLLITFFVVPAQALLNIGLNNLANTSAPVGVDVAWDATARMANYDGSAASSPAGTAVHLGNGYMLTAMHVIVSSHVSFNGTDWLAVDATYTPVQVAADVDLQIFKLAVVPTTSEVTLHTGGGESGTLGYSVGWGRGREFDTQIGDAIQDFGKDPTIDKRWGTNVVRAVEQLSWEGVSATGTTYTQQALVNVLGDSAGVNEAALALWDSGSPFFQEINGTMVLTGIAGTRSMQNGLSGDFKATFGDDRLSGNPNGRGDANMFVQIGAYADEILAIVPEPASSGWWLGLFGLLLVVRRR